MQKYKQQLSYIVDFINYVCFKKINENEHTKCKLFDIVLRIYLLW